MVRANLSQCDLVKANLARTVLYEGNLAGADIKGTRLFYGSVETATLRSITAQPDYETGKHTGVVIEKANWKRNNTTISMLGAGKNLAQLYQAVVKAFLIS